MGGRRMKAVSGVHTAITFERWVVGCMKFVIVGVVGWSTSSEFDVGSSSCGDIDAIVKSSDWMDAARSGNSREW